MMTMRPAEVLQIEPRGLSRVKAAAYIDVSPSKFDELVKDGRMPSPKRIDGRKVWDRLKLDEAFTALPDDGSADSNPWAEVL
jgi:predicted DNA-binding transcriptional regulator AlpA